jgi:hypothetical protein
LSGGYKSISSTNIKNYKFNDSFFWSLKGFKKWKLIL